MLLGERAPPCTGAAWRVAQNRRQRGGESSADADEALAGGAPAGYNEAMMSKRQSLIERVATLPEELLDEVAESVEDIVAWHQQGTYHLSDDERAAVRKGMEAARRGEFASDDEIAALYNRNRE